MERRKIMLDQIADMLDRDVGRGIQFKYFRVGGVVALARKHSGKTVAPYLLHRSEYPKLVVDHYVVLCRIQPLDVEYLQAAQGTLSEWHTAEDEKAYGKL